MIKKASPIDQESFERIIETVRKPSSYLGVEPNSVRDNSPDEKASIALVFPDLYEIGMSHHGLKILYHIINSKPDLVAERVFAPGDDFAEGLRREGLKLPSLERRRPLTSFDVVGFTIPYELSYTTILYILDLAGITRHAKDRIPDDPYIAGGGAGVYNPEPLAPFFDFFVLGDGEYLAETVLRKTAEMRGAPRSEVLSELSLIEGVYVPSLFDVSYKEDGGVENINPKLDRYKKAKRVFIPTLTESPHPVNMVIPFGETAHDRIGVEIDRGCTQGCRFCQAGTTYRPVRERTPAETIRVMDEALMKTGYGDISVTSLSTGDYSAIEPLLGALMDRYADKKVALSLPSLRSGTVTEEIVKQVRRVKKTGFTITAEAGTQRLRNVLNKKATEEEILNAASLILKDGWRNLKLYFMIGLPTETMEDIDAIYNLASKLAALNVNNNRFMNITLSAGNFVPKPHTAFQWGGQDSIELLQEKKERLFALIKNNRRIKFKWNDPAMSHLEAVFSRGDRRLSSVIEKAYEKGQFLDAWSERFSFARWMEAFDEAGIDTSFYANRDIDLEDVLPWDHIDTGLSKKYFIKEWCLACEEKLTDDCKTSDCLACGINPQVCFKPYDVEIPTTPTPLPKSEGRFWYRLKYEKMGQSRFFSHLEIKKMIERSLRVAEAPITYSEGFSPHPRISYGPAASVGHESLEEFCVIELKEEVELKKFIVRVNASLPEGLLFIEGSVTSKRKPDAVTGQVYKVIFKDITGDELGSAVRSFLALESYLVTREKKGKVKNIDIRKLVSNLVHDEIALAVEFSIVFTGSATARPIDIIAALFSEGKTLTHRITKIKNLFTPL